MLFIPDDFHFVQLPGERRIPLPFPVPAATDEAPKTSGPPLDTTGTGRPKPRLAVDHNGVGWIICVVLFDTPRV